MTISYRILQTAGDNRIECCGQIYGADELHEAIWLVNMELRYGLPKKERIEAKRQIRQYNELLTALRGAGPYSPRLSVPTPPRHSTARSTRLIPPLFLKARKANRPR